MCSHGDDRTADKIVSSERGTLVFYLEKQKILFRISIHLVDASSLRMKITSEEDKYRSQKADSSHLCCIRPSRGDPPRPNLRIYYA